MKIHTLTIAAAFSLMVSNAASAQVIGTDNTFGNNGVVVTDLFGKNEEAADMVEQPDGKIIVVGSAVLPSHSNFTAVRYNEDGTLDTLFGNNGVAIISVGPTNSKATAVALQNDGKILLCGYFDNNFYNDAAVVRLNADGTPDSTFGSNGVVQFIISNQFDEFHDIVLRPDGRIIVGGRTFSNNTYDFLMAGLLTDGSPDTTFGMGGIVIQDFSGTNECIFSMNLVANDKILVTGNKEFGTSYFMAARFHSNGAIDNTFGNNGYTVISSGNRLDKCNAFALQSDSSMILAGTHHNSNIDEYMIVRLNSSGNLDTTFGANGMTLLSTTNSNDAVNDLLIQYDNRILLAGSGKGQQPVIIRLNRNGDIDTTFGNLGFFAANSGSAVNSLNAILMLHDSSIVTAGFSYNGIDDDFLVSKALVDYTSSVKEIDKKFEVNIYPNPAKEYVTVSLPFMIDEPGMITVFDEHGRVMLNSSFAFLSSTVTVGLPVLPPGIYYLRIKSQSKTAAKQFIVQ